MEKNQQKIWQNAINPQLEKRLIRPLSQPGVINFDMATKVLLRTQHFNNRNPLLKNPRWSTKKNLNTNNTPIVYAQPSLNNQEENSLAISPNTSSSPKTSGKSDLNELSSSAVAVKAEKINSLPPIKSSIAQPIIQRKVDTSLSSNISDSSNITSLSNTEPNIKEEYNSELPLVEPELKNLDSVNSQQPVISQPLNQDNHSNQENINKINLTQTNESSTAKPSELPLVKTELNNPESVVYQKPAFSQPLNQDNSSNQENINQISSNPINQSQTAKFSELPLVKPELNNSESIITQSSKKDITNLVNINSINDNRRSELVEKNTSDLPKVTIEISTSEQLQNNIDKPSLPIIYPHTRTNIDLIKENNINKQLQSNSLSSKNQKNSNIPVVKPIVKPENNINIYSPSLPKEPLVVLETPKQQTQQNFTPLVFPQNNSQGKSESLIDSNAYQHIQHHNNNQNNPNSSQTSPTVVNQWLINNQTSQKPENNQPKIDINAITNQVERKLKRKFMVETERRGYKKWR